MLKSEIVNKDNLEIAVKAHNSIFPRDNAKNIYLEAIKNSTRTDISDREKMEFFIVKNSRGNPVGIWGHYVENEKSECWLRCHGVIEAYRKKSYGTQIFEIFENWAYDNGFETIRLYADDKENKEACMLYEKLGMKKEFYMNPFDITRDVGQILIYSKSLVGKKVENWNSRFIDLKNKNSMNRKK